MVKDNILTEAQGLHRSTETWNARAETLGPDGGPQTRKPGPGGAVELVGTEKYTQDLFRLKMVRAGRETGAGGGGARDMGAAAGKPGGGALRTTRPTLGTTRGTGGQRSVIDNCMAQDNCREQKHKAGQGPGQRRLRRHVATARHDT